MAVNAAAATVAAGRYLQWGVIQISLANLLVILAMIAVFILALVVPFPRPDVESSQLESKPRKAGNPDDRL